MLEPSIVYVHGQWKREQVVDQRRRELEATGYRAYPVQVVRDHDKPSRTTIYLWTEAKPGAHEALEALTEHLRDLTQSDRLHIGVAEPPLGRT